LGRWTNSIFRSGWVFTSKWVTPVVAPITSSTLVSRPSPPAVISVTVNRWLILLRSRARYRPYRTCEPLTNMMLAA